MFVDYKKAFDNLTEIKNLKKPNSAFGKKTKPEQDAELQKRFADYLQTIEKNKLYYFVLASENKQKVLVVKCPTDNKEQKQFLGYEWSSAKGNEGIKYINQSAVSTEIEDAETKEIISKLKGLHNINTPLYNPNNRNDLNKINHFIQQNFLGNELTVSENLISQVAYYDLADMLDFNRKDFNKQISLSPKNIKTFQSKWELAKIETLCSVNSGGTPSRDKTEYWKNGTIPWLKSEVCKGGFVNEANEFITELGLQKSNAKYFEKGTTLIALVGATKGKTCFLNFKATTNQNVAGVYSNNEKILSNKFIFFVLLDMYEILTSDLSQYDMLNLSQIRNIKIPLPPIEIQSKIVAECESLRTELSKAEIEIEKCQKEIEGKIQNTLTKGTSKKLSDVININQFAKDPTLEANKDFIYVDIESVGKGTGVINYGQKILGANAPSRARRLASKGSTIISTVRPNLKGFAYIENEVADSIYSTGFAILQSKDEKILLNKIIYCAFMYSKDLMKQMEATKHGGSYPSINKNDIENFKLQVPSTKDQIKLVEEIEKLEKVIIKEQLKIDTSTDKKKEIMKKYL
jgi:restriction endonuclease S subunit